MTLQDIQIQNHYRSENSCLVDDFYVPCLKHANEYKRAVGYFTSSGLAAAAKGLLSFINKDEAQMKLIASPQLEEEDVKAIKTGYSKREEIAEKKIIQELDNVKDEVIRIRLDFLAWMIAKGKLDIKLAFLKDAQPNQGIFHEKLGVFQDQDGNTISFTGSPNETQGGLYSNYEAIDVFKSWNEADKSRTLEKNEYFRDLWNNNNGNLDVVPFPEVAKEKLKEYKSDTLPPHDPESKKYNSDSRQQLTEFINKKMDSNPIHVPEYIKLRDYQEKAVESWFDNDASGVMKMATGTGKTITALTAATHLRDFYVNQGNSFLNLVVCPYQHLVMQWEEEAKEFGYSPITCFKSRHQWLHSANSKLTALNSKAINEQMYITTTATFRSDAFQDFIQNIQTPSLIIADEVHNMGTENLLESLPDFIQNRLGLSATPERWFDEKGTENIFRYFGDPVIEFGLGEAIENGHLTEYEYHPTLVPLTDGELNQYMELTKKVVQNLDDEEDFEDNDYVKRLLIKRARLTASAENKIDALKTILQDENINDETHNLIYCGDGTVDSSTHDEEMRQIEAVTKMLGNELNMFVSKYVAETDTEERKQILNQFEKGELQALVAIRCLDEGVDVPATRRAFILASSSNPRQFIQRRGRVLREAEGKELARIWDFLVFPPYQAINSSTFNIERNMIKKELKRVTEFTKLARNGPQAQQKLNNIKKKYNLLHL